MGESLLTGVVPDNEAFDGKPITLSTRIYGDVVGQVNKIKWLAPTHTSAFTPLAVLYDDTGTAVWGPVPFVGTLIPNDWNEWIVDQVVTFPANMRFSAAVVADWYTYKAQYHNVERNSGHLHADINAGQFSDAANPPNYPTQSFNLTTYLVDVDWVPSGSPPASGGGSTSVVANTAGSGVHAAAGGGGVVVQTGTQGSGTHRSAGGGGTAAVVVTGAGSGHAGGPPVQEGSGGGSTTVVVTTAGSGGRRAAGGGQVAVVAQATGRGGRVAGGGGSTSVVVTATGSGHRGGGPVAFPHSVSMTSTAATVTDTTVQSSVRRTV